MKYLICPKCKTKLLKQNNSLVCENKHCYDISSKGYVNLLIHKSSQNPGDNKEMVEARKLVMQMGYYNKLIQKIKDILLDLKPYAVLDLACGEGSLTACISSPQYLTYGVDISKSAINIACSRDKISKYVVASINNIPLQSKSMDVVLNCFAPLDALEVSRVLKDDGILIKITPYEKHLFELKQAIYPEIYLNKQKDNPIEFTQISSEIAKDTVTLEGDYLDAVVKMTPYFYKTPKELLQKIQGKKLDCSLEFCVTLLKKSH